MIKYLALLLPLAGCATQGTSSSQYTLGSRSTVVNEATVDGSYGAVWDSLVRDLAKSFYVINNIDKESRIINVSFSSSDAEEYVDCGRTQRTFTDGGVTESFNYAVAAKSTFKVAASRQEHPSMSNYSVFRRESQLEGRANIYIAPVAGDLGKTTVSVNARYVLSTKVRGEAFAKHVSGNILARGRSPDETYTYTFNTAGTGSLDAGSGVTVTCFSKGKLEGEVLAFLAKR